MASSTPVTEVMTKDVVTLRPDQSLAEAADVLAEHWDRRRAGGGRRRHDRRAAPRRGPARSPRPASTCPTTIAILPGIEFTLPEPDPALRRGAEEGRVVDRRRRDGAGASSRSAPTRRVEDVATLMHEHDVTHVPVVVDDGKVARDRRPRRHRPLPGGHDVRRAAER